MSPSQIHNMCRSFPWAENYFQQPNCVSFTHIKYLGKVNQYPGTPLYVKIKAFVSDRIKYLLNLSNDENHRRKDTLIATEKTLAKSLGHIHHFTRLVKFTTFTILDKAETSYNNCVFFCIYNYECWRLVCNWSNLIYLPWHVPVYFAEWNSDKLSRNIPFIYLECYITFQSLIR